MYIIFNINNRITLIFIPEECLSAI